MSSNHEVSRRGFLVGMAGVAGAALAVGATSPARGAANKPLYTPEQAFK